jgi:hypothetical protein
VTNDNPFTPNDPATPDVFGGRINELHELCEQLVQAATGKTVKRRILGERGIGKTSVLNYLESYARGHSKYGQRVFTFLVVRQSIASTTTAMDLLVTLDTEIRSEIGRIQSVRRYAKAAWDFVSKWSVLGVEYKGVSEKKAVLIQARKQLAGLIKDLAKTLRANDESPHGLVLILDECDLASPDLRFGELMKSLAEDIGSESSTLVVICGLPALDDVMRESHPSSFRAFRKIDLGRIGRDDVADLIDRCMTTQRTIPRVTTSTRARELLIALSEGFPHFAQEFGFCAFAEVSDGKIDADDVATGASKPGGAIDRIGEAYQFGSMYDSLDGAELELVLAIGPYALTEQWVSPEMVRNDISNPNTLDAAFKSLVRKGVLLLDTQSRKKYKFRHNAFAYWVKLRESRSHSSWAPVADLFGPTETESIREFKDLRNALKGFGISESSLLDLQEAIQKDREVDGIGPAVAVWISRLIASAAKGYVQLELDVAAIEIPRLVTAYLNGGS